MTLTTENALPRQTNLLGWYENFSNPGPPNRAIPNANQFWRVEVDRIEICEAEMGFPFPKPYKEFLLRVGEGHFALGNNGIFVDAYNNEFLGPERVCEIIAKKSGEWLVYPEFIEPDEFPFFDLGNASVLVFRRAHFAAGTVYYPGSPRPICETFEEFLSELREDAQFYVGRLGS